MSRVHDFESSADDERRVRPAFDFMWQRYGRRIERTPKGSAEDRAGIDLYLGDRRWKVDEKHRWEDYGDCLVETWSVWCGEGHPKNRRGWTVDPCKQTEVLAYAVIPAQVCWLLRYGELRDLTLRREAHAIEKAADNGRYVTRNVAIPWAVIEREQIVIARWEFIIPDTSQQAQAVTGENI